MHNWNPDFLLHKIDNDGIYQLKANICYSGGATKPFIQRKHTIYYVLRKNQDFQFSITILVTMMSTCMKSISVSSNCFILGYTCEIHALMVNDGLDKVFYALTGIVSMFKKNLMGS